MRTLLYDQDRQRNKRLQQYLEDDNIAIMAAYCLKDFLMKIEKPSLKILLIEHSIIQHYNIDIDDLLNRLGLAFIVIVYSETAVRFEFTIHYLHTYFYFPFTTEKDKELIHKVKKSLQKFSDSKQQQTNTASLEAFNACYVNKNKVNGVMDYFTEKQKQLITKFLEKKEGISIQEISQLLNAHKTKNSQNYVQTHIYRLRNKLNRLLGKEYIISYKNHTYQLLRISQEV